MILSIDYGKKRIGLAISDETETIAVGIDAIIMTKLKQIIDKINSTVQTNNVSEIILGLPLGIDEKPTQISKEVQQFAEELKKSINTKITFWNETFTSNLAKNSMKDKRNGKIDSESARIILQEYLDFKKEK